MKNSLIIGCFIGVISPLIAFVASYNNLIGEFIKSDKISAPYVIAAVINLIIVRLSYRYSKENFGKGVIIVTFLAMIILIFGGKLKVY